MSPTATRPVDTEVKVPAGVRAASERAAQFHNQAYGPKDPPEGDPKAEPEKKAEGQPEGSEGNGGAPAAPEKKQDADTPKGNDDWEHRYRSMAGRYDQAERRIREMGDQLASMQRLMATMNAEPKKAEPVTPKEAKRYISDEEVQEYGPEFIDLVGRKAQEVADAQAAKYEKEISDLRAQLGQVNTSIVQDQRQKLFRELDGSVPEWRDLNTNPKFLDWLALPDTYSGAIRQNMLNAAFERNDSPRVAAFFKGFLAEEAALAPAEPGAPRKPAANAPGKVQLEDLAAPGRAKTSAAPTPDEKPTITRAQITAFYAKVNSGGYRDNPQEKAHLEKMIFEAERDGRIR